MFDVAVQFLHVGIVMYVHGIGYCVCECMYLFVSSYVHADGCVRVRFVYTYIHVRFVYTYIHVCTFFAHHKDSRRSSHRLENALRHSSLGDGEVCVMCHVSCTMCHV